MVVNTNNKEGLLDSKIKSSKRESDLLKGIRKNVTSRLP